MTSYSRPDADAPMNDAAVAEANSKDLASIVVVVVVLTWLVGRGALYDAGLSSSSTSKCGVASVASNTLT